MTTYYLAVQHSRFLSDADRSVLTASDDANLGPFVKGKIILATMLGLNLRDTQDAAYKLQWRNVTDGGSFADVAATGQVKWSATTACGKADGDAVAKTDMKCTNMDSTMTWQNGLFNLGDNLAPDSNTYVTATDVYTEFHWAIDLTDAHDGDQYEFLVYNVTQGATAGTCAAKVTTQSVTNLTVANVSHTHAATSPVIVAPGSLFSDDFESGGMTNWTSSNINAGDSFAVETGHPHHGSNNAKMIIASGGYAYYRKIWQPTTYQPLYYRTYFKSDNYPGATAGDFFKIIQIGTETNILAHVRWERNAGVVKWALIYLNGAVEENIIYYSTVNPTIGSWYCVELGVSVANGTGQVKLYVDGTLILTATNLDNDAGGDSSRVVIGSAGSVNSPATCYYDCVRASEAYIGVDTIIGANLSHAHSLTSPILAPVINLVISDIGNDHVLDAPAITQLYDLSIQDCSNSHDLESYDLTQLHILASNNLNHSNIIEEPVLDEESGAIDLVIADLDNAHILENISLVIVYLMTLNDLNHGHDIENTVLTQIYQLESNDLSHIHDLNTFALIQLHILSAQDINHAQTMESVTINTAMNLSLDNLNHFQSIENPTLTQIYNLAIADGYSDEAMESPTLTQKHQLVPGDVVHSHISANVELIQIVPLTVANLIQAQGMTEPILMHLHNLALENAFQNHDMDAVILLQNAFLAMADIYCSQVLSSPPLGYEPDLDRILYQGNEDRTLNVQTESRTLIMPADDRILEKVV